MYEEHISILYEELRKPILIEKSSIKMTDVLVRCDSCEQNGFLDIIRTERPFFLVHLVQENSVGPQINRIVISYMSGMRSGKKRDVEEKGGEKG